MADAKNWYDTGYGSAERDQEKRDLGEAPKRYWMKAGETKELVWIDDLPFCLDEHSWTTAESKFPKQATCLAGIGVECPACANSAVGKPLLVGHMTAVDITGYTKRDGTPVKYELIEFCPKTKVINKLKVKKNNKGSLIGKLYNVTRADDNAPNTGDDFDEIRDANLDALYKVVTYRGKGIADMISQANAPGDSGLKVRKFLAYHFQIPESGPIPEQIPVFNYVKLHEPLEAGALRAATTGAVPYGGSKFSKPSGGSGGASSDENVPF